MREGRRDGAREPLGRDFRLLLTAGTVSNVGDGVDATALPLLAAALTTDPRLFAGVAVAGRIPWLLFALQAGALADRLDRRRVMATVNVVRGVLLAVLAAAVLADVATVWLLYLVGFGLGTAEVLFDTSAQAFLPRVVRRDQLERANGLQMGLETVANQFVGPPLGGLLFAAAAALPLLLDAGSFVVAAVLLALVGGGRATANVRPGTPGVTESVATQDVTATVDTTGAAPGRRRLRDDIREGLAWLRGHRLLRSLAVLLGLMNGTAMMAFSVFALFALEVLGLGEVEFGLLLTAMAVGSVAASVVAERVIARLGRTRTLWCTLVGAVVLPVVQGSTSSALVVAAAAVLSGLTAVLWNVITVSLRQAIIPDHLLGRVNSVYRFLGWGSMPVGAWLGGEVAARYGLRAPFFAGAAIMLVGLLLVGRRITAAAVEAAHATPVAAAQDEPA